MRQVFLTVILPCSFVALVGVSLWTWERGALPGMRPEAVEVSVSDITKDHRGVRIRGTAHLGVKLKQTAAGSDTIWWVYPFTEPGQTHERLVKVVVRTTIRPDPVLGFEDRTIEGFARPPGRLLPRDAREALERKGYELDDDIMLVEEWVD